MDVIEEGFGPCAGVPVIIMYLVVGLRFIRYAIPIVLIIWAIINLILVHKSKDKELIKSNKKPTIIKFVAAFLVFIIYYMYKKKKYNIEFALIIGGLIGNLIDRIVFGFVIDYIGVIIFKYYFPIFNIADALIVIGAIILLFRRDGDKNEVSSKW